MFNSYYPPSQRAANPHERFTETLQTRTPEHEHTMVDHAMPTAAALSEEFVVVGAPATAPAALSLGVSAEKEALSAGEAHSTLAMISLAASAHEPKARLPLEIVAVVDRSGSMRGDKIAVMKETLSFLVSKGLQSGDSLAIVSFDDTVEIRLPLSTMDAGGKSRAIKAISELQPGRTTNLSGGLLQGIDLLQRAPLPVGGSTRAVLLFTDGIANVGITDGPGIVSAAQGAMMPVDRTQGLPRGVLEPVLDRMVEMRVDPKPMTIFTFGFGSDHNEDMLRSLAGTTNGLYYYLANVEAIPLAFADCLGGLVAVVAQNVTLLLTPSPRVSVARVHGSYTVRPAAAQGKLEEEGVLEVSLGDVYAEEAKDLVLQLALPALTEPSEGGACLLATLRYYSVPASRVVTAEAQLIINRPAATPAEQPVNIKLEEQRLRVAAAEAMAQAAKLADQGRLNEGRAQLQQWRAMSRVSPACESANTAALQSDLDNVEAGFESESVYRSLGSKMSKMSAMSHAQQRSTHATGGAYERASKKMTKSAWSAGA